MAEPVSGGRRARISAELREAIEGLLAARPTGVGLTLHDVRVMLQSNHSLWSQEGELLHPEDRTAFLIEIDQLIDQHGGETPARNLLGASPQTSAKR